MFFDKNYPVSVNHKYHRHFDNNRQTQELLMVIRDCYLTASLREKGRKTFYERQAELFAPKEESSQWEDIRQAYIMAALWMPAADVKDDFCSPEGWFRGCIV